MMFGGANARMFTCLLLLILCVAFFPSTTQAQEEQQQHQRQRQQQQVISERQILLDFYAATGGSSWNNQYGWKENGKNICSWYGVYCLQEAAPVGGTDDTVWNATHATTTTTDDTTARQRELQSSSSSSSFIVAGLELSENYLTGTTPISLWSLSQLRYLSLAWNDALTVDVTSIEQATRLQELRIAGTATSLPLVATQLVPLAPTLTSLHASALLPNHDNNNSSSSTSTLPTELWSLTELRTLHVANCSLQGPIDWTQVARLSQLQELDLYYNYLTGTLPTDGTALATLSQLSVLVLADNLLHGTLPDDRAWPNTLQYLYLEHNQFTGPLPSFHSLTELKLLTLQENQLTGSIPFDFLLGLLQSTTSNTTTSVVQVNLAGNLLTGTVPASLAQLAAVPLVLDLADNQFTAVDASLCSMDHWMQGQVASYGCFAILCPLQTYHPLGYESRDGGACWSCPTNTRFRGSTTCSNQEQDMELLQALFTATQGHGGGWTHSDGWNNSTTSLTNYCTWYGITCWDVGDARDGRVRAIRLPFNNLQGTLPDAIFQLAQLTLLDVSSNINLTVSLEQMQSSPHLQVLNIGHTNTNDLTGLTKANGFFHHLLANHLPLGGGAGAGPIPSQVFGLKSLKTLSLASCQLTGTLPLALAQLTELQELYLYDNELQGTLPATTLNKMTNLRIVSLAQNQLTGTIPELSSLTLLQAFSLYDQVTKGGGLVGPLPAFDQQTDLTNLQLAKNQLNGTLPTTLLDAVSDVNASLLVDLSQNGLTGTVPGSLSRFPQMNIYLQDNQFTQVDSSLCLLPDWMSGAVAAYGCSGILCPSSTTGGRQQFDDVTCSQCPTGDGSSSSSPLWGQTQCANITSSSSTTTTTGSNSIPGGLTQENILQSLFASSGGGNWYTQSNWNDSSKSVCDWYGIGCDNAGSVTSISLGSNRLSGNIPTELFLLPQLKQLSLFSNLITFSFDGIEHAVNLHVLILDETGLTSLTGVGNAVGLRQLNVRYNQLAGSIPTELSQLTDVQALGLSGNGLTGTIPTWFSQLTLLQTLLLDNNQLTGTLYDFESLSYLQYLDLSSNRLSGTVPPNLLPSLPPDQSILVDLSKNRFTGTLASNVGARGNGLALDLQDNQITAIDSTICNSSPFQCDGILCPIGTYNSKGRQILADAPCNPCPDATFMGSTQCGSSSSKNSSDGTRSNPPTGWIRTTAVAFAVVAGAYSWML